MVGEVSKYPALWIRHVNNDSLRQIILNEGCGYFQNSTSNFYASEST